MTAPSPRAGTIAARFRLRRIFVATGLLLIWSFLLSSHGGAVPRATPGRAPAVDWDATRLAELEPLVRLAPRKGVRAVVLLLSDSDGWTPAIQRDAAGLAEARIAVLGVATPRLLQVLATGRDRCISPDLSLSLLAKDFEHRLGLKHYLRPILAGRGLGANVAFASLAQSPAIFAGAVSLGFDGRLPTTKPWCWSAHLLASRLTGTQAGWQLGHGRAFDASWVVAPLGEAGGSVARTILATMPHGRLLDLQTAAMLPAVQPLMDAREAGGPAANETAIGALPIATVVNAAAPPSPFMAVFYSGDGGWASFDRDTAGALAARGVPVVGIDSLSYFWSARKPVAAAADLARVIDKYRRQWGRQRVILVGFSFGADNLPFIANALPARLRPQIARISLLGLSDRTDFQFHLASWLDMSRADAMPTVPAIARIRDMQVQCIRGDAESDSACIAIPRGSVLYSIMPGSHHLKRDFPRIAGTILTGLVK